MKKFNILKRIITFTFVWSLVAQASIANHVPFLSGSGKAKPLYKQELPFEIPTTLPAPAQIADSMASQIDPDMFLRGASTSEHQCSTRCTAEVCSWSRFAKEHNLPQPTDERYMMDLWTHYRSYIDYAKDELHLNALRFSIEWALVQPDGPMSWDQEVLDHYADMFVYAIKKGITPLVCFHHYTDPCWFIDAGGFVEDQNLDYFVSFCSRMYQELMNAVQNDADALNALHAMNPRTPLWATYNSPEGYVFRGYHQKQGPPADPKQSGLRMVVQVLHQMLEAHVRVYYALKKEHKNMQLGNQGIAQPKIGLLKNIHQLDPAQTQWLHYFAKPVTKQICAVADAIQNKTFYNFFTKGIFKVSVPFVVKEKYENPAAIGALDFIGLNYYSNRHMYLAQKVTSTDSEQLTDNPNYCSYPQGIYRAIVELSEKLVIPFEKKLKKELRLYVSENGVATQDDEKRYRFYHEYLYAMNRAVQDGYKIYGYLPWTLASNYEWPALKNNTHREYGLCSIDPDDASKLIAKKGSRSYVAFAERMAQLGK